MPSSAQSAQKEGEDAVKFYLSLLVAVGLLLGVTYLRYPAVYSQMSRDELEISRACAASTPRGSYDGFGTSSYRDPALEQCERQAKENYHLGDTRRYLFGAWLWGAIAAVLGGLITSLLIGRRQSKSADRTAAAA
jgi:hypothetical protein